MKTPDLVVRVVPRLGERGPRFRIEPLKQFETNYTPAGEA